MMGTHTERARRLSALLTIVLLCPGIARGEGEEAQSHEAVRVRTATAAERVLKPAFTVMGAIVPDPKRVATLAANTAGIVSALPVSEGASVATSDVVVQLDEEKARIDLDRARAAYARLVARPRPQDLDVARGTIDKARAAVVLAESRLRSAAELRKENPRLVPSMHIQELEKDLAVVRAENETAQLQFRILDLGPRPEQRREAQVEVAAAEFALRWCKIRTPISGVLSDLKARAGMHVDPGTPLGTVIDLSTVLVQVRIPSQHISGIIEAMASARQAGREGTKATVHSPVLPGGGGEGTLFRLGQETEGQTGDMTAWVRLSNPDGRLRAGMTVSVDVEGPAVRGVAIPESALTINDRGQHVVTVVRDGKAASQVVQLAGGDAESRSGGLALIREGVKPGELVAVENGYALPEGYPVTTNAAPASPSPDSGGTPR